MYCFHILHTKRQKAPFLAIHPFQLPMACRLHRPTSLPPPSQSQVTEIARTITTTPRMSSLPACSLGALMFSDTLLLLTDPSGSAVREPLFCSGRPLAMTHSGSFLVIVSEESGLQVFDVATARSVQAIPFSHDDPWVAASGRLPACADSAVRSDLDPAGSGSGTRRESTGRACGAGHVLLATASTLFCLQPVEMEDQVCSNLRGQSCASSRSRIVGFCCALLVMQCPLQLEDVQIEIHRHPFSTAFQVRLSSTWDSFVRGQLWP